MALFRLNLTIDQGATFRKRLTWKTGTADVNVAVDLTGFTARMQLRPTVESATILASLTTANGGITLGGATGTIDLYLDDLVTAALRAGDAVYDLELVSAADDVTRFAEGEVVITPEVTR